MLSRNLPGQERHGPRANTGSSWKLSLCTTGTGKKLLRILGPRQMCRCYSGNSSARAWCSTPSNRCCTEQAILPLQFTKANITIKKIHLTFNFSPLRPAFSFTSYLLLPFSCATCERDCSARRQASLYPIVVDCDFFRFHVIHFFDAMTCTPTEL
jgi:hypothetical protein